MKNLTELTWHNDNYKVELFTQPETEALVSLTLNMENEEPLERLNTVVITLLVAYPTARVIELTGLYEDGESAPRYRIDYIVYHPEDANNPFVIVSTGYKMGGILISNLQERLMSFLNDSDTGFDHYITSIEIKSETGEGADITLITATNDIIEL